MPLPPAGLPVSPLFLEFDYFVFWYCNDTFG
jgi:hypothetical protein